MANEAAVWRGADKSVPRSQKEEQAPSYEVPPPVAQIHRPSIGISDCANVKEKISLGPTTL